MSKRLGPARPSRAALQGTAASQPVGGFHSRLDEANGRVVCRMTSESADGTGNTTRGFGQPNVSRKASEKKQLKTERIVSTGDGKKQGSERRQLFLQFECNQCNGVSQFMINKDAYENGIVICTCQKCGVRHLLADNLKKMDVPYFGNNIEEYMHSKGSPEEITKGTAPGLTPEVLEKFDVSVGADGVLNLRPKSETA